MDSSLYCESCGKHFATPYSKRRHDTRCHSTRMESPETNETPSPTPTPSSPTNSKSSTDKDADSESSETSDSEADQPDGILRAMVSACESCDMRPKTTRGLLKLLKNPNEMRKVRRALKEEIHGSMQYAKDLQNAPEWKRIKETEQKMIDQVHIYFTAARCKHF